MAGGVTGFPVCGVCLLGFGFRSCLLHAGRKGCFSMGGAASIPWFWNTFLARLLLLGEDPVLGELGG